MQDILHARKEFMGKLKTLRSTYLQKDLSLLSKNVNDLKYLLCSMLAFLIIQHQIDEIDKEIDCLEGMMKEFQTKLTSHLIEISKFGLSHKEIFSLKKVLHYCAHVCKKNNLRKLEDLFLEICDTLLPIYFMKLSGDLSGSLEDWPQNHAFKPYPIQTLEEYCRPFLPSSLCGEVWVEHQRT